MPPLEAKGRWEEEMDSKTPYGILLDDEKHTFDDFGLRIISINIDLPDVKENKIKLSGADGYVDMTDYFGAKYENRKITITCDMEDKTYERWTSAVSQVSNYVHGKKRKLVFDWDSGFYYVGRGKCKPDKDNRVYSDMKLTFDCEPYKYEFTATDEDWLWDPFDFETGIIREYANMTVSERLEFVALGSPMPVIPEFIASASMQVVFAGVTYEIKPGTNYFLDIEIKEGDNAMTFIGTGIVTVKYRGGSL